MAITILGALTDTNFGLDDMTGVVLQTSSYKVSSGKKEMTGASGEVVALAYYGFKAEMSIDGYIAGAALDDTAGFSVGTSFAAAAFGSNMHVGFGADAGTYVTDSIDITDSPEDFRKLSASITMYPEIAVD